MTVESHVRGLRALGVNTESYGQLLSSILMNKLPAEMRLIMSHKLGTGRWDVEEMMKTINLEVEVRERSAIGPHHQRKPPSRSTPPTSSTLYRNTEQSGQCVYCGQSHTSTTCTIASDVDGRTEILRKAGRCYVCLKKHHGSRNYRSRINCDHCRGIITTLCTHIDQGSFNAHPPLGERGLTTPTTNTVYTDARVPVLLQTARLHLQHPHRIISDISGA